ncbi:hypothetical protein PR048_001954 [Dryococelus australis]|uniref:Uncharacterized protein n=1 Tax=Dryococelus australis TaxID=614101 RepID=A0ABQ9IIT0_9NEOP|nr:hypothetical protein PR048_001954 [Dryococelus australis]
MAIYLPYYNSADLAVVLGRTANIDIQLPDVTDASPPADAIQLATNKDDASNEPLMPRCKNATTSSQSEASMQTPTATCGTPCDIHRCRCLSSANTVAQVSMGLRRRGERKQVIWGSHLYNIVVVVSSEWTYHQYLQNIALEQVIGLKCAEKLPEYCNEHAPLASREWRPPVLKLQKYHLNKVLEARAIYGNYIKDENNIILASKPSSLSTHVEFYTKDFMHEIMRIGGMVEEIYIQSEPMCALTDGRTDWLSTGYLLLPLYWLLHLR